MEEDFYYLNIKRILGLIYKLQCEINEFLIECKYDIKCKDYLRANEIQHVPSLNINNYNDFMDCRRYMAKWEICDSDGNKVSVSEFQANLDVYLDKKIIEETYFANYNEPKWNSIKKEIEKSRSDKEQFILNHKKDFLEFFIIQYLRIDSIKENEITDIVEKSRKALVSLGAEEDELQEYKGNGLLDANSYFYGILFDAAKGKKERIYEFMKNIDKSYIFDIYHSSTHIGYVTSTSPCVVTKYLGDFKAEILFPVSPKFCLKLTGKTLLNGREGRYFEQSEEVVKKINRQIINDSKNIVFSDAEYIADRI